MPAALGLKQVLTRQVLRQLAGARSFERGEDCFDSGQVCSLVEHAGKLTVTVQGTDAYQVELSTDEAALFHSCTWPDGCKS
jgi:uncharacterized Zn finger protein